MDYFLFCYFFTSHTSLLFLDYLSSIRKFIYKIDMVFLSGWECGGE